METMYQEIGGEPAVSALVEVFYDKVLHDHRINYFFKDVDLARLKNHQVNFIAFALGGRPQYSGLSMRQAHRKIVILGVNDSHFDAILELLQKSLEELKVDDATIFKIMALIESQREHVLGRSTGL